MANLIGKLLGVSGRAEASSTRLGEDSMTVEANSWNTFVKTLVDKHGQVHITIARSLSTQKRSEKTTLATITLNDEMSESPIFAADGLLIEQVRKQAVDEYVADQMGLDRNVESDLFEDR